MSDNSTVYLFMDDDTNPLAALVSPVRFELDTTRLADGPHTLKIVSKDPSGKEGIRLVPFEVRNGPSITVEGIRDKAIVDGIIPVMINAYGIGDRKKFLIAGSENPLSIPYWVFLLIIFFVAWAIYFGLTSSHISQ